jgi:hypothetical protein
MATIVIWMRYAAEYCEVFAKSGQSLQVRRSDIVAPRALRKEVFGQQANVVADPEESAWYGVRFNRWSSVCHA